MATLQPPRLNTIKAQSRLLSDLSVAFRQRHTQITFALVEFLCIAVELLLIHNLSVIPLAFAGLVLAFLVAWITARPLAIFAFLREVRQEMRQFYKIYTPLSTLKNHYETPIDFHAQDETRQEHSVTISSLIRNVRKSLLILGLPGAGKTISLRAFEYEALKEGLSLLLSRKRIPIYISMREYNAFLYKYGAPATPWILATPEQIAPQGEFAGSPNLMPGPLTPDVQQLAFIQYLLHTSDIRGLDHLRPYLERLIEQGCLLLLCDGLNEIDQNQLPNVCNELIVLMQHSQNLVVMTCRELDYRDKTDLQRLVKEKHAAEALILPLDRHQIRNFIEQYLHYSDDRGKPWQYAAGKFVSTIEMNGMIYNCTNPLMLVTMMQIINEVGDQQGLDIDTRGRLLSRFVFQIVRAELQQLQWTRVRDRDEDIILFLSYVACTARRAGFRNAIQLDPRRAQQAGAINRLLPIGESAALMLDWLNFHTPGGNGTLFLLSYSHSTIELMLDFAQRSALISISPQSILSFRHELIAEFFVAEYLRRIDTTPHSGIPLGDELLADIGRWSEPVSIWAGMIDDPMDLARRLASLGQRNPAHAYAALALSLICMGVMWKSPRSPRAQQQRITLPHDVLILLRTFVTDDEKRDNLAGIINRAAKEGGIEVYRSLLPLLLEGQNSDFDALLLQLDRQTMPQLLLDHLRDAIDASWSEDSVNRLIRILGLFGAGIVRLAGDLLLAEAGTRLELRIALIKVLGRTNAQQAVKPLIARLSETEPAITTAAVNALGYLGPNFVLDAVAEELRNRVPAHLIDQIHWAALATIEYFLQERHEHVLTQNQYQRIIDLLLLALAKDYHLDVRGKAFSLLLQQGTPPTQEQRRLSVITSLSHRLGSEDEKAANAIIELLKRIGIEATASLLEELKINRVELARVRAIEILGEVLDPKGLEPLLLYLSDASPKMQEQLAIAFYRYAPASIAPLIRVVRTDKDEMKATRANAILILIGASAIKQIIQALLPLVSKRTELLLDALAHIQDEQAIKPLIGMLKSLRNDEEKAAPGVINSVKLSLIRALGTFHNQHVVLPLRDVLLNDSPVFSSASQVAMSGLGELAVTALVDALNMPIESDGDMMRAARVEATLLAMQPFPDVSLLKKFTSCSEMQAKQLMKIFIEKGDTAAFLVPRLIDPNELIRKRISEILSRMTWEQIQGPLLDNLKSPGMIEAVKPFLLKYKQSIPLLVHLLGEKERGAAAVTILLAVGIEVIAYLVPGLEADEDEARRGAQDILVRLVKEQPNPQEQQHIADLIVGLFAKLTPLNNNLSGTLPIAWDGVLGVLINDLVQVSIPALLRGLEVAKLQRGSIIAFVRLIRKHNPQSEKARQELLEALRDRNRRSGAVEVFVALDAEAVDYVSTLVIDKDKNDPEVEQIARDILRRIGGRATLRFIWTHFREDTPMREVVLGIFRQISTDRMKDTLVQLLTSSDSFDVEMAVTLLIERITHDDLNGQQEMIQTLFEHVQTHSNDSNSLHVIGVLLLQRKDVIFKFLDRAFRHTSYNRDRSWIFYLLLLLGIEGDQVPTMLRQVFEPLPQRQPSQQRATNYLKAEAAALMGLLKIDIDSLATDLHKHPQSSTTVIYDPSDPATPLDISLRALGGLLASGKWDSKTLQTLYNRTSQERDVAVHELYSVLLGNTLGPKIGQLEQEKNKLEQQYNNLKRENALLQQKNKDLEKDNKTLNSLLKSQTQQGPQQQPPSAPPPLSEW